MKTTGGKDRESAVFRKLSDAKKTLGEDLLLLAHFYQNDGIVRLADFVGDSLQLADKASHHRDAKYIVFCSVSFMAETARILCAPEQEVLHPEPASRCPLADMAALDQVEAAWSRIQEPGRTVVPVVYVNSNADLKAFCGRNGGMVCTSSNVKRVFDHVLSQGKSVFFFPDENMGRNVSRDVGISDEEIALWDPETGLSGDSGKTGNTRVFLWEGFCIVHKVMSRKDIWRVRKRYDGIQVIVHPECVPEVYGLADFAGSTSFIRSKVETSEPGSRWAIGTEWNFVNRIKVENPDKLIVPLRVERCREMAKVTPSGLLRVLQELIKGGLSRRVEVDAKTAAEARIALDRMLDLG